MKNALKLMMPAVVIAISAVLLYAQFNSKNEIEKELSLLNANYGDIVYESFYSIPSIKPFSIIQLEKTIEMYDNKWIDPSVIVSMLEDDEKEVLLSSIADLIEESENIEREHILHQIKNWCIAKRQFEFLDHAVGLSEAQILNLLLRLEETKNLADKYDRSGSIEIDQLQDKDQKMTVYTAVDKLSAMNLNQQMSYYSNMYKELSTYAFSK